MINYEDKVFEAQMSAILNRVVIEYFYMKIEYTRLQSRHVCARAMTNALPPCVL